MIDTRQATAGVYARQSLGNAKSIQEQILAGKYACREHGWTLVNTYQDGSSASRYAKSTRDDWSRCLADIKAGKLDILVLWEASRGDRTLTTWSGLLDELRAKGVQLYVVSDERLYDPRRGADWKALATAGVDSAAESDKISMRVKRGHSGAAQAGRPSHGRTPLGFTRTYDPATGALVGQVENPETSGVVKDVFAKLAKGVPVSVIAKELSWHRSRVRSLAANPAYAGLRVYNGQLTPGTWEPLVEPDVFFAVQRILAEPGRSTIRTRPGSAVHLLSYLARCTCGEPLNAVRGKYRCSGRGCVYIDQRATDRFVEGEIIWRLSQPDIYGELRQAGAEDDQAVLAARNDVAVLQARLDEFRLSAARGQTSPASLATIEATLSGQIQQAQARLQAAEVPVVLRDLLDADGDVRARWAAAPVAARRRVIEYLAEITVGPATGYGFDRGRLGASRWTGDHLTWSSRWINTPTH